MTTRFMTFIVGLLTLLCTTADVCGRVYEATTGRWLTRDPAGFVDGPNLYQYVQSNPLASRDPLGLMCTRAVGACGQAGMGWLMPGRLNIEHRAIGPKAR